WNAAPSSPAPAGSRPSRSRGSSIRSPGTPTAPCAPTGTRAPTTSSPWTRSRRWRRSSRNCTACVSRRPSTSSPPAGSPTSASPTRASSAWSPRPGSGVPNSPPSTAASTSGTTGRPRRSCWSTNADTPTSLVEAASPQWFWMEERFPGADQWNSLHERLVDAWKKQAGLLPPGSPLYFAHSSADELGEDLMTVAYLKETAEQAGLATEWLSMEEIGWDRLSGRFVDNGLRFIRSIFKLYPWEWLTTDRFAGHVLDTLDNGGGTGTTLWIEPAWKMLLSNKALLAILWELYPGHPNLLPAHLDGPRELADTTGWVAKPLLGREGAGVTLHEPGTDPVLRDEPCCYQQLAPLPTFDGNHVVLGAWVVEDESAGLGIRESSGPVTDEYARFLPHVIL
ncbi:LOW QUALITY PROTEIN: glutathionylspermidine synthase, partial [Streptomyces griseoflavus Tu4000]